MEKDSLSPQESLDLISSMIRQAKGNFQGSSFYFLLWGWTVAIANLAIYLLLSVADVSYALANRVWLILIPVFIIYFIHGYKDSRESKMATPIDTAITWVWISYAITIAIIMGFGRLINYQINPLILISTALPTLLTGKAIKFKPLVVGGLLFWAFGILCFLVPSIYQYLIAGFAFIIGYIVPGHLLKNQKEF